MSVVGDHVTPATSFDGGLQQCLRQHQDELLMRLDTWMKLQQARLDVCLDRMEKLPVVWVTEDLPEEDTAVEDATLLATSEVTGANSVTSKPWTMNHELRRSQSESSFLQYESAIEKSRTMASLSETTAEESVNSCRASLRLILSSWTFEILLAALIIANALYMGVEVEYAAQNLSDAETELGTFHAVGIAFTSFFALELMLRIFAFGPAFLWISRWNYLDLIVVVTSILNHVVTAFEVDSSMDTSSSLRLLRFARITRLVRALRIGRVVRIIGALRSLVDSILYTLKSLMWSLLLLVLLMFSFSLLFTDAAVTHLAKHPGPWAPGSTEAPLAAYFGGLRMTMDTLYRAITNGIGWASAAEALDKVDMMYSYLFNIYIFIVLFAVINVLTAVFCQAAIDQATRDHESRVQIVLKERDFYVSGLTELFKRMDIDGNGRVTLTEFIAHFNDPTLKALFEALGIETSDAWSLFKAIDFDGDLTIDPEEFLEGCMLFKGQASALDIASVKRSVEKSRSQLATLEERQARSETMLQHIHDQGLLRPKRNLRSGANILQRTNGIPASCTKPVQSIYEESVPPDFSCSTTRGSSKSSGLLILKESSGESIKEI
eukprot:TRINITY_DN11804_c0_g1_i3.p1 TRINITY_DN11804_c0_g1~~TRINITY_DN11804_c0_g1_i3.p1  ORF type:complete len:606 (-),score=79.24 TRINITY_DN11804_c0_g1_i3:133-1950(-)